MAESITILALDVGEKRVGVSLANSLSRLPRSLPTLVRDYAFWGRLGAVVESEGVSQVVIGLPKSLEGQETEQTIRTRNFAEELKQRLKLPVVFQDEALTSWRAQDELSSMNKSYQKGDLDALSAVYILEDYLSDYKSETKVNG